jgi:hypothetical protein
MLLKIATILSMHATVTTGMETIKILTRPVEVVDVACHIATLQSRHHQVRGNPQGN